MKTLQALCFTGALLFPSAVLIAGGGQHHHPTPVKGSEGLERLKQLAGVWEGKDPMSKEGGKMTVEYRVTAGGSAVEEKLGVGTPMEMVTMYYDQGGVLQLTHYCSMGNRPTMQLKGKDAGKLEFTLAEGGIGSAQETHMHALSIVMADKNSLVQNWTLFEGGKEKGVHSFAWTRRKT